MILTKPERRHGNWQTYGTLRTSAIIAWQKYGKRPSSQSANECHSDCCYVIPANMHKSGLADSRAKLYQRWRP